MPQRSRRTKSADSRWAFGLNGRRNGTIAGKPRSKDSSHLLGIKPICLGEPTPARFEKACRVE